MVALVYVPVARVLANIGSLADVLALLRSDYYRGVAAFSVYQAFLSTVAAVALGLPGAYFVARYRFPGRRFLRAASTVPFILPSVLVVLGFVLFWGNNGYVNRAIGWITTSEEPVVRVLYSLRGIILAHAFYNFPICLRIVAARWERLHEDQALAARSLGASRSTTFFTVTLPRLLPALASAASLIFLFCFTSFAVILVLGGGPKTTTLEVEVYRLARMSVDLDRASQVALVQTALSAVIILAYLAFQGRATPLLGAASNGGRVVHTGRSRGVVVLATGYAIVPALLVLGPIVAVVARSVLDPATWGARPQPTFRWYAALFTEGETVRAIGNSLAIGVGAAALATVLGSAYAWGTSKASGSLRSMLELVAVLPLGISPVVLGLGYFYIGRTFRRLPDIAAIAIVHGMLGFPFVVRTLVSGFASVAREVTWAARGLGANRITSLRTVELPLIRGAVVSAAGFAFALSVGELNAAIMLSGGRVVTIPVAMYRLVAAYRFTAACALGTLLMALAFSVFVVFEARRPVGTSR